MFNMGIQDPSRSTEYAKGLAQIDQNVLVQTNAMLQTDITNGLTALTNGNSTLVSLGNMQIQQDQAFTNALSASTQAAARVLVPGGNTITVKAA
jgi:hypothetical protein